MLFQDRKAKKRHKKKKENLELLHKENVSKMKLLITARLEKAASNLDVKNKERHQRNNEYQKNQEKKFVYQISFPEAERKLKRKEKKLLL